jgi:hypothetical protein
VVPCSSEEFPRPARRPRFAWLRNDGVPQAAVRPWREALAEHLASIGYRQAGGRKENV